MWDVRCEMWDVRCEMWDVRCGMWDVRCEMWGAKRSTNGREEKEKIGQDLQDGWIEWEREEIGRII